MPTIYPTGIRNDEEYQLMCQADDLFDELVDYWYSENDGIMPFEFCEMLYRTAYERLGLLWLYERIG